MSESVVWTVAVLLDEAEGHTDASAALRTGDQVFEGWGRARHNPADPAVPRVGEELATARALVDLAHKLIETAAHTIEQWEGHPVTLHS